MTRSKELKHRNLVEKTLENSHKAIKRTID